MGLGRDGLRGETGRSLSEVGRRHGGITSVINTIIEYVYTYIYIYIYIYTHACMHACMHASRSVNNV